MRDLAEIEDWESHFEDKVWYSRHKLRREAIERGPVPSSVDQDCAIAGSPLHVPDEAWANALEHANKIEVRLQGNVGPWSDYEWGKINGKLSALRWVLGLDWDMLDT